MAGRLLSACSGFITLAGERLLGILAELLDPAPDHRFVDVQITRCLRDRRASPGHKLGIERLPAKRNSAPQGAIPLRIVLTAGLGERRTRVLVGESRSECIDKCAHRRDKPSSRGEHRVNDAWQRLQCRKHLHEGPVSQVISD